MSWESEWQSGILKSRGRTAGRTLTVFAGMKPGTEQRHGHRQTEIPLLPPIACSFPTVLAEPPHLPPPTPTPPPPPPPPIQSQRVVVRVCVREFQQPPSVEVTFMRVVVVGRGARRSKGDEGGRVGVVTCENELDWEREGK